MNLSPSPTFTLGAVLTEPVSSGAAALKGTHRVDTAAPLAQAWHSLALIYICKGMRGLSEEETKAPKGSHSALVPRTSVFMHWPPLLTLAGPRVNIGDEAPAAGVWLGWAELTWEAPGPAHSGTAECLGADEACQLVLAPLRAHSTKAGPCPVVCRADGCGSWPQPAPLPPSPSAFPSQQAQHRPPPLWPGLLLWPPSQPPYTNTPGFVFFFPDPKPLLIVPFPYLMNSYSSFKTLSLQSNVQPTSNRSQDLQAYRAQSMSGDSPPSPRPTLPAGLGRDPWTPCERAGPIPEQPLALPNLPDSGRDPASTKCSEPTILHC